MRSIEEWKDDIIDDIICPHSTCEHEQDWDEVRVYDVVYRGLDETGESKLLALLEEFKQEIKEEK